MEQRLSEIDDFEDVSDKQLVPLDPLRSDSNGTTNTNTDTSVVQQLIKSTAIVKYGLYNYPVQFSQLHSNTNLNKPPSNWLRSSSPMERYIQQMAQPKQRSPYASFHMGNSNLDEVGQMDVISDSENIKNLMKLPYNKSQPISMMVHRIGKTLFLDEFDVQKNLLRQQQEDWKWLKKFYHENVMRNRSEQQQEVCQKPFKKRNLLQSRNMFSKFLYYSVEGNQSKEIQPESELGTKPATSTGDVPSPNEAPAGEFTRTVQWTFEDIRMLIGTDLPIFGGGTHPCVSLRLRDMHQPINVLTGLDYWLDNLMCNVPELAMCYHLDGIVQKYELVSTKDIPTMENSKFSPSVIRDVAQNILSFLKTNVTKEGHTYWLFKGHNDDIIKLYDLTTLCSEDWDSKSDNPFTVPVGILLFRVARNIMMSYGREKSGTVRTLLKNCLALLDPRTHAQVVATACYMLADLYIKDDVQDQELPKEREEDEESDKEWDEESGNNESEKKSNPACEIRPEITLPVTSLCLSEKKPSDYLDVVGYAPMSGDVKERCKDALKIIVQGLTCLDRSMESSDSGAESTPTPDIPIPLSYEKLNTGKEAGDPGLANNPASTECTKEAADLPVSPVRNRCELKSWQVKLRRSVLHKAVYVYYWLGDLGVKDCEYGLSLRCLRNALTCYHAVKASSTLRSRDDDKLLSSILTLCGDVHMMLSKDTTQFQEDMYSMVSDYDKVIMSHADASASQIWDPLCVGLMTRDSVAHLSRANDAYRLVVELLEDSDVACSTRNAAVRRYGSSYNELGVIRMNELACICTEATEEGQDLIKRYESKWTESLAHFHAAVECFDKIDDRINIALVHSNRAKLMRVLAQGAIRYNSDQERAEFSQTEKEYFLNAIDAYRLALSVLANREQCSVIWNSVRWELSTTYFNLATLLQDYAPRSSLCHTEIEKEVTTNMDRALKYCDTESDTGRLPSCQYRAATIHHRLASLYHNSFRNQIVALLDRGAFPQTGDQKKKHLRMLADLHYEKACKYFHILESACELLRVTLERVAMCEFHLTGQSSPMNKIKTLRQSLTYLIQCKIPLSQIMTESMESNSAFATYVEEALKLSGIFASRLQFTLLNLVKLVKGLKKSSKAVDAALLKLKEMYACSLQKVDSEAAERALDSAHNTSKSLIRILATVEKGWGEIEGVICGQDG